MKLLKKARQLNKEAKTILDILKIESLPRKGQELIIGGSFKYELLLSQNKDIDLYLVTDDAKAALSEIVQKYLSIMENNPLVKKMLINNFYDNYKQKKLVVGNNLKSFFLNLWVYKDMRLKADEMWEVGLHIIDELFLEPFPGLEKLKDSKKEELLRLKQYYYDKYEIFYPRSALIYQAYLEGNTNIDAIMRFLKQQGINLIKIK